ncbi:MAG: Na(+)-translocating NADH-quinone reductase subunit C [Gammaproteobacteria bacterium AqS3]|nr:Na(+)-translocating NADH-quinone reductase subunit C [Gammaproteobacteria bacterium AqS3]
MVALLLCAACSVVVSFTAVSLRPLQEANALIERKRSVLQAAGRFSDGADIEAEFSRFEVRVVDLESGEFIDDYPGDPLKLDARKLARDAETSIALPSGGDPALLRRRENLTSVYLLRDDAGALESLVLPVRGYGLWGTLYGYIALSGDLERVDGLVFYEHKETPGLGGEVDNPSWRAKWRGKTLRGADGDLLIEVIKGQVDADAPEAIYQVDGLAGATLTSRGVTNMVRFWLGETGFGALLVRLGQGAQREEGAS